MASFMLPPRCLRRKLLAARATMAAGGTKRELDDEPSGSSVAALLTTTVGSCPLTTACFSFALTEGAAERPESGGGTAGVPGGTWWPASTCAAARLREGWCGCMGSRGKAEAPLRVTTMRLLATSSSDAVTTMRTVHAWCGLPLSLQPSRQTLMPPHTRWQLGPALPCAARPVHAISHLKQLSVGLDVRCSSPFADSWKVSAAL